MEQNLHMVNVSLGERTYEIVVCPGIINQIASQIKGYIHKRKCLIITDSNVAGLFSDKILDCLKDGTSGPALVHFPAGEENKNLATVEMLLAECCEHGLDRSSIIIAFGGGVPGDIAGFVAAIYMRGIDFVQVPTTLLAMVDSSVGGKTGVDLPHGKNLVGAFWQPRFVLIDPDFLKTLPEEEITCGLAEVIKYGMIMDSEFFSLLEENIDKLRSLDPDFYSRIISHCCRLKAHVVTEDERESGLRAILNYGHTFGHAIEKVTGFAEYAHGEAVAVGMCIAMDLAAKLNLIDSSMVVRQKDLLDTLGLPVKAGNIAPHDVLQAMFADKKAVGGNLRLVLPEGIGNVAVHKDVDNNTIMEAISANIR